MTTPTDMARAAAARRARYLQLRSSISPQQAQNIAALARENPSLSPGALYAAGVGGVQAGTPSSKALSEGDQQVKSEKGNIFQRAVSAGYKGVKIAGGAVLPDAVGDTVNAVAPTIKGVSRGIDIGVSAIGQTFQGAMRSSLQDGKVSGSEWLLGLPHLAKGFRQTDLYHAHREVSDSGGYTGLLTGRTDVDYGSGFFAGGDVAERSGAARKQAAGDTRIGGSLPTVGRFLASEIGLEPGKKAYNIVSGLADMSVSLGADPLSFAGAPTKALQSRRLFAGDASKGFDAAKVADEIDQRLIATKAERFGYDADAVRADMGALTGIRDTVASDRVLEWLTTKKEGQQLVAYAAKTTDFGDLYDRTKGKIDPQLLLKLTEREMTGDEVIEILGPSLGRTARTEQKFGIDSIGKAELGVGGLGTLATATFKQRVRDTRIFGTVPERVLPKNDLGETLKNADSFMRNAFITGDDRSMILRRFAEADGGEGMYDVAREMMKLGAKSAMENYGIDGDTATKLFKLYEDSSSGRRKFWQEQVVVQGEKYWANKGYNVTDEVLDDGSVRALPHLASQFLDANIPLPDPRKIRAEMSRYRNVLSNPAVKVPTMALEKISDNIFKPAVLLRPAYIARNQIDEQFRPAGVGLNSLMRNPVQYLQWTLTDQAGLGRMLNAVTAKLPGERTTFQSRGATYGPDGQVFDEQRDAIRKAREVYKDAQRSYDPAEIERTKKRYEELRDAARHAKAVDREAALQAAQDAKAEFDEVSQRVDRAKAGLKAAKDAVQSETPFTDGVSQFVRSQTGGLGNWRNRSYAQVNGDELFQKSDPDYARAMGEALHLIFHDPLAKKIVAGQDIDQLKADWWRGPLQGFRGDLAKQGKRMAYLNDEIGAAQYVDDTVKFIESFVAQSPELRQAAATGKINGVPLTAGDTLEITPKALAELDALKQLPAFQGPDAVIGSSIIKGGAEQQSTYTKVIDWAFYQLADRPTRYLSKSPVFRQRYYRRMENLIGFMDDKAASDLIESARVANLRPKDIKRLESKRRPGGKMTFEEADLVGKTDALEFTQNLFYDLHHRGQFFDVTRLLFPFGEAFLDSARKYTELVANNPVLPYRLGQIIEGGRAADVNGDGKGFFYTDEQTGEEMFAFPGSSTMLEVLGQGGAGQLRAPVKNLNILGTTVIPGFGPAVQIAAASVLPDEEDFNAVREFISPYGDRTLDGGALESFLPSWFSKFRTAELVPFMDGSPKQQRAFVQTQKDWMGYLASTGEYDLQDPADAQRLIDDAKSKARTTFFIRGMAQSFAPSPPSPEFLAYDKDGRLMTQFKLAEEYRRIQDEQRELGTPEATNRVFIETFGEQAVLAVIPNTKAAQDKSPTPPTRKALEFYQNNKKAAERFPSVFGMFAPDEEGADFDFVAYNRQVESGERVPVTPEEAVRRANQNVARMILQNAKDVVGPAPSKEQKEALRDLRAVLAEDFPGYSASFSNDTPGMLEDLKRAAVDPTLGKTPAAEGLRIWLKARDAAEQAAQARFGVSWKQSPKSREIRDSMRALADELSKDFEGFSNIYERALEREMARE